MKKLLLGSALATMALSGAALADGHGVSACLITKTDTNPFFVKMREGAEAAAAELGITLNSYTLRPKARGTVRLRSGDPKDAPVVDPNFLGHPDDLKTSVEGVKISCEIFSQPSLQKYIRAIRFPDDSVKTQADFEAYARQYGRTSYHPSGTCKMGADAMAVV